MTWGRHPSPASASHPSDHSVFQIPISPIDPSPWIRRTLTLNTPKTIYLDHFHNPPLVIHDPVWNINLHNTLLAIHGKRIIRIIGISVANSAPVWSEVKSSLLARLAIVGECVPLAILGIALFLETYLPDAKRTHCSHALEGLAAACALLCGWWEGGGEVASEEDLTDEAGFVLVSTWLGGSWLRHLTVFNGICCVRRLMWMPVNVCEIVNVVELFWEMLLKLWLKSQRWQLCCSYTNCARYKSNLCSLQYERFKCVLNNPLCSSKDSIPSTEQHLWMTDHNAMFAGKCMRYILFVCSILEDSYVFCMYYLQLVNRLSYSHR